MHDVIGSTHLYVFLVAEGSRQVRSLRNGSRSHSTVFINPWPATPFQ